MKYVNYTNLTLKAYKRELKKMVDWLINACMCSFVCLLMCAWLWRLKIHVSVFVNNSPFYVF